MHTKFKYPLIQKLWELTGEIGALAENNPKDERLDHLTQTLGDILDACEENGLIEYTDECEHEHGSRGGVCEDCGKEL